MFTIKIVLILCVLVTVCCILGRKLWFRLDTRPPEVELEEVERLRRIQEATKIIE